MDFLGNIIWLFFGGLAAALGYLFGGIVLCITVVGIPWGLQCFKIAGLVLWPFGRQVMSNTANTGCLSLLCNIIWLLCGGIYTALVHITFGIFFLSPLSEFPLPGSILNS